MLIERKSGSMQSADYSLKEARLEGFEALTSDWLTALHRLIKAISKKSYTDKDVNEHKLTSILENNLLTVLADIRRKNFSGYSMSYSGVKGTSSQIKYITKISEDIKGWIGRLDNFISLFGNTCSVTDSSVSIAIGLRKQLNDCVEREVDEKFDHHYYDMLQTMIGIQNNYTEYIKKIEECSDTDPAISLLASFIRNYCKVAELFNTSIFALPELYRKEILQPLPQEVSHDYAYLIVTPNEDADDFVLPKGTLFAAGENLSYKTISKEIISHMQCEGTMTLSLNEDNGDDCHVGWQIESPLFVMDDGNRTINIKFIPTNNTSDSFSLEGLNVLYSSQEGWIDIGCESFILGDFILNIGREMAAPIPCSEDIHGTTTEYPVIRMLTSPNSKAYNWAKNYKFTEVNIIVSVDEIRNFSFINDLGEVDTTQSFALFGVQADKGAWFAFGKDEIGMKNLKEASLKGTWNKLPDSVYGFNQRYSDYGVDASNFCVSTEYRKNEQWKNAGNQPLFSYGEAGKLASAYFNISFKHLLTQQYKSPLKDGYFRIVLQTPEIGFGSEMYRSLFMQRMLEISKNKKTDDISVPKEPCVPYLSDVEMSYKAEATFCFPEDGTKEPNMTNPSEAIRLTRIMEFTDSETFPPPPLSKDKGKTAHQLMPDFEYSDIQYFAFSGASGKNNIRMYVDMILPDSNIPFEVAHPGQEVKLKWSYWDGRDWNELKAESVTLDDTKGLTQSGYVEIAIEKGISSEYLDKEGQFWIRASMTETENASACLKLRNVWTNCIKVVDQDCFKEMLPAGTIQGTAENDERINSVVQPYPSFGGKAVENERQYATRLSASFCHRKRSVTQRDYEMILLELFPEVDMIQCLTIPAKTDQNRPIVCLVVFSRKDDPQYYLSPAWKLSEMELTMKKYAPACVNMQVTNPKYEKLVIHCGATLQRNVVSKGKVMSNLTTIICNYFMPWRANDSFPQTGKKYSFWELYSRIVNHEDIRKIFSLIINKKEYIKDDGTGVDDPIIHGTKPWSVLLPEINITLVSPDDGIDDNGVGKDFVIG